MRTNVRHAKFVDISRERKRRDKKLVKVREAEMYIKRNKFIRLKSPIPPPLSFSRSVVTEDQLIHGG